MKMDVRKLKILKAIIDEYVLSAAPVGSRSISRLEGVNLSSATIRNEMADLEEMGYLEQPHTSAGRVPSNKAYRLYVDQMLHRSKLTEDEMRLIRRYFTGRIDEIDGIVRQTAKALSEVTHYTAVVLSPEHGSDCLRHLQLVPLAEGRALLVVVTDRGFSRDAVIRIPNGMSTEDLEQLSRMLTSSLYGCQMDMIETRIRESLTEELRSRGEFLTGVLDTIRQQMAPDSESMTLAGATNMLHYPEYRDVEKARNFLSAVEGRESLYRMMRKAGTVEFSFTIGAENEMESLKDCSVVTATYKIGDMPTGTLGVIGPTRMDYGRVAAILEFMRSSLGEILSNYLEEGER